MLTIPGYNASGPDFEGFTIGKFTEQPVKPADIILTASALDSRVSYSGPSHYFFAKDGKLTKSSTNEWPLEYVDGVAAGRHAPEPASTNIQVNCRAIATSANVAKSTDFTLTPDPTGAPDGGSIGQVPNTAPYYMVTQDNGNVQLVPLTHYALTEKWTRFAFPVKPTQASRCRIWVGRNGDDASGNPFLFLTQSGNIAQANYVFSWFARASRDGQRFPAGLGMIETGNYPYATSPIITESSSTVTRDLSKVTIKKDGNSKSINIYFSDNTKKSISFNGAESVDLPFADYNWSEKYISRIEYEI